MFVLQNTQIGELELPHLTSQLKNSENGSAKSDLSLELFDYHNGLTGRWEYATALFDPKTIH
jgi:hypothetical protein